MQLLVEQFEKFAGVVLQPTDSPVTDEQFFALCVQYPDYRIETTAEGAILVMPLAHPRTGQSNAAITHQFFAWAEQKRIASIANIDTHMIMYIYASFKVGQQSSGPDSCCGCRNSQP